MSDRQRAAVVVSVKPRYAEAIFAGEKTVELRKSAPRIDLPSPIIFYVTSPGKAVQGLATFIEVDKRPTGTIWAEYGESTGLTHEEFRSYYASAGTACALVFRDVEEYRPIPLSDLQTLR